jgi:hypothetical protein
MVSWTALFNIKLFCVLFAGCIYALPMILTMNNDYLNSKGR